MKSSPSRLIPTEDQEQRVLVQWLELKKIPHHHSVNEMWTTSYMQKRRNRLMGMSKGFPDLIVAIPPSMARNGGGCVIAVELKRANGGRLSPHQKIWIELLNRCGVPARRCDGANEAIKFISGYLYQDKRARKELPF